MPEPVLTKPDNLNRLPYIDGLRAVAALMVLLTHTYVFTDSPALGFMVGKVPIVLGSIPAIGHVGVNLFLVLSGFCLAWPFFSNPATRNRTTAAQFWLRRAQRIVPAYFASMIFVCLLLLGEQSLAAHHMWPTQPETFTGGQVLSHLFFVHNLDPSQVSAINGSYWSLALEFQLYFLFPLLLEAMRRFGVWSVVVSVLVAQLAYRLSLEAVTSSQSIGDMDFVLFKSVFGRWFDFVAGMASASVVAAMARGERAPRRFWMPLSILSLVGAFAMFYHQGLSEGVMDLLWGVGFASLVCWAADSRSFSHRVLSMRWLTAIGVMSYSLYLVHQPLMEAAGMWIRYHFHIRPGSAFFVALVPAVGVIGIAAVFYFAFERPALRYFANKRRRPVDSPAPVPIAPPPAAPVPAQTAAPANSELLPATVPN